MEEAVGQRHEASAANCSKLVLRKSDGSFLLKVKTVAMRSVVSI